MNRNSLSLVSIGLGFGALLTYIFMYSSNPSSYGIMSAIDNSREIVTCQNLNVPLLIVCLVIITFLLYLLVRSYGKPKKKRRRSNTR